MHYAQCGSITGESNLAKNPKAKIKRIDLWKIENMTRHDA